MEGLELELAKLVGCVQEVVWKQDGGESNKRDVMVLESGYQHLK